jgi:hypothetical protein
MQRMGNEQIQFNVGPDSYTLDIEFGSGEVVIHTSGGDITATWEEGEGFHGIRGLSQLDDDFEGDAQKIVKSAEMAVNIRAQGRL